MPPLPFVHTPKLQSYNYWNIKRNKTSCKLDITASVHCRNRTEILDGNKKWKIDRYFAILNRATNVGFHTVTVF